MMKLAIYKNVRIDFEVVKEVHEWTDDDSQVRLSETMDVEFIMLPVKDTLQPQVDFINDRIKSVQAEATNNIATLEEQKARLLALPNLSE